MNQPPAADSAQTVSKLFARHGRAWYGGERVSQLEHALQAATFAESESAETALIVAALLHDVGHLLHDLPEDAADQGIDDKHELIGGRWLAQRFGPEVVEPVTMHVDAKRYLCGTDPAYHAQLSPASQLSLQLQGGPMTVAEQQEFESRPYFRAGVQLRHWDDRAKVENLETAPLEHFLKFVTEVAR